MQKEGEEEVKELADTSFDSFDFKKQYDLGTSFTRIPIIERRKAECLKIREKYPNRIPVIVARMHDKRSQDLPNIDQNKYNLKVDK